MAYAHMYLINAHAGVSSVSRCPSFGLGLHQYPLVVYASSEGSCGAIVKIVLFCKKEKICGKDVYYVSLKFVFCCFFCNEKCPNRFYLLHSRNPSMGQIPFKIYITFVYCFSDKLLDNLCK